MKPSDIHRQLCEVCGKHAMSDPMVRRWVRHFNERSEYVRDYPQSGRPSVVNEDLLCAVEEKIQENKGFTILSLSLHFLQISRRQRGQKINVVCIAGGTILRCMIQKLMPRYDKCLDSDGNYVDK
jgi:hypothetical protein